MVFSTYEELMAAVEERRKDILTLEVDLGSGYSPEHEDAKKALEQAKAMQNIAGNFLASNIPDLEQRVADTRPPQRLIWLQFEKLDLNEWRGLMNQAGMTPVDQFEKVLPKTFKGLFGSDPAPAEEDKPEGWEAPKPLTTDPLSVSSRGGAKSVLPGGALHSVVQSFMAWQNSGGEVTIRPTKSGLV